MPSVKKCPTITSAAGSALSIFGVSRLTGNAEIATGTLMSARRSSTALAATLPAKTTFRRRCSVFCFLAMLIADLPVIPLQGLAPGHLSLYARLAQPALGQVFHTLVHQVLGQFAPQNLGRLLGNAAAQVGVSLKAAGGVVAGYHHIVKIQKRMGNLGRLSFKHV